MKMVRNIRLAKVMGLLTWFGFLGLMLSSALAAGPRPLSILRITPNGVDVPPGRQIVFQFNRPVVPVGRMERSAAEIPIRIAPALDCRWRWLNTSALACELEEKAALQPATRYEITVEPGLRAEDGATLSGAARYSFITERPAVRHAWFKTWKSPGTPQIRMTFNQPVSQASVQEHVFMVVTADRRQFQLLAEPDPDIRETPLILPVPGEKYSLVTGSAAEAAEPSQGAGEQAASPSEEARRVWLVSPLEELPLDAAAELRVKPGLVSYLGPEKGSENRLVVAFDTFPEFRFAGVECTDNRGNRLIIAPEGKRADQSRCNPLRDVALLFSAPVISEEVKEHATIVPNLAGDRQDYDPWANRQTYSSLSQPHRRGELYRVWLPEMLKAYEVYRVQSDPENFRDEFGRTLPGAIDMQFATDHRPPDFTLTHPQTVLEKAESSEMPVVVTNLGSLSVTFDSLTAEGRQAAQKHPLKVAGAEDISFPMPLGIRDMLQQKSGVVQGSVDSTPFVPKEPWQRRFFAQVTPFQVHVKVGHYNSLVWVTELATGEPVVDAAVAVFADKIPALPENPDLLTQGRTDATGVAMVDGMREIDPQLKLVRADGYRDPILFVRVTRGADLALVPLNFDYRVDTYRASYYSVYPSLRLRFGHIHAWGTTAQGVYRAGDTIEYKLYVRDQSNETLVPAPSEGYRLKVVDPMGKTVHEIAELSLSQFGAFHGEYTVPAAGPVGWYQFQLSANFSQDTWYPMRVLVSDFTPAPFRVSSELNGTRFQPGDSVEVSTLASLHAGGPYADAPARVTATLESRSFPTKDPQAKGFYVDVYVPGAESRLTVHQSEGSVDQQGSLTTGFTLPETTVLYGRMVVESAVRDDRGKYITSRALADYAGRERYVGLRQTAWVLKEDDPAAVEVLVMDQGGRAVAGTPVAITIERRETKASRVKGAGNAYLTDYTHQWVPAAECNLVSALEPVSCSFIPADPGSFRVIATVQDTRGRSHSTQIYQWVAGKGQVVWEESPDNRLEIIAEQESYQIGDTARYLVKNPFPGARALVTVERYGVLKGWVEMLETSTPLIEFPVEEDFLPGFFLSVVVVSARVERPPSEDQVDLGKPAFRMGYVRAPVTDAHKQLMVEVVADRENYKPRETVKIRLQASARDRSLTQPVEFAVAVLDEAVLDLLVQGKDYFDPYKGFYTVDGLDLENYSLLMRLVGRQKFEKKGADSGGGGGMDVRLRSVFKFVSYWNPSLIADTDGKAVFEFEAPDNLTGWRVLAMAATPGDRMGLGDSRFTVNQPTEIRSVMPNQVTAGDTFTAGFSIMNRTEAARTLTVTVTAEGVIQPDPGQTRRSLTQTLVAEPYRRVLVWLPLKTTADGQVRSTARAGDAMDQDGLVHMLPVRKNYTLETAATYGIAVSDAVTENLLFPEDIRTDVGRVSVVLAPSVIGNLEGAFRYLRDYPYICWEQILTQGVMAAHYKALKSYISEEFTWPGYERLPDQMLQRTAAYQAPNGGMVYYVREDRYVSPYLSAYTALAFNWLRAGGYAVPADAETRLHEYLLTLLKRDVLPDFYTRGMASTVRAAALAALAEHGKISRSDIERYQPHVPEMSLFGKAHFLQAALRVPGTDAVRTEVCNLILAHADQSGGKFVFSETIDDSYTRILTSPLRENGAILSALVDYAQTPEGAQLVGDIPFKLVRTITQTRKNRDHWENTQENMFCVNALVDYARRYEAEEPDMQLKVRFDAETLGERRFTDVRDEPAEFQRHIRPEDLGREAAVTVEREGRGRLYYGVRMFYAPKEFKAEPINAGIEIHREYSVERNGRWVLLQSPMEIRRGELVRVDLFASLAAARNFVVVDDPVPGGLEPVSRDLATASIVDADKGQFQAADGSWWFRYSDWSSYGVSQWSFYHKELRHHAARFYSEYLPAGNYHLSYTAQAIAPGEYVVKPVHAEDMYDPDVYGKGVAAKLVVVKEE